MVRIKSWFGEDERKTALAQAKRVWCRCWEWETYRLCRGRKKGYYVGTDIPMLLNKWKTKIKLIYKP